MSAPPSLFIALARESQSAYDRGAAKLKSLSGSDLAESELYIEESRFWQRVLNGAPISQALALSDRDWRSYAASMRAKIDSAPKIKRGPRAGQSWIDHKWVDDGQWAWRERDWIRYRLDKIFPGYYPREYTISLYGGSPVDPIIDPSRRFYVSISESASNPKLRYGLLLGPFRLHSTALDLVKQVSALVRNLNPWADFYAFGTCSLPVPEAYEVSGRLNDHPKFRETYLSAWEKENSVS